MAANILAEPVRGTCGAGKNRFMAEVARNLGGQFRHRAITATAIFLERFHGDPVEITSQRADQLPRLTAVQLCATLQRLAVRAYPAARLERFMLPQIAQYVLQRSFTK